MFIRRGKLCLQEATGEPTAAIAEGAKPSAATDAQATPPAAATPAPSAPAAGEPAWLPERIERAKRSVLNEAGFKDADEAKAAKAALDATKSEQQKTAERLAALEPKAQQSDGFKARLERYADSELAKLTEPQRAAVTAIIGDDKTRALDVIVELRPTWASGTSADAKAAPVAAETPKQTAPGRIAPTEATTSSVASKLAEYTRLKDTNPFAASNYLAANYGEIERERATK